MPAVHQGTADTRDRRLVAGHAARANIVVVSSPNLTTAVPGPDPRIDLDPAETSYLIGSSELDPAGVMTKIPHPDVRIVGSTECFVHRNHLASVTLETGAAAAVVQRQRYTAFGDKKPITTGTACGADKRGVRPPAPRRRHRPDRSQHPLVRPRHRPLRQPGRLRPDRRQDRRRRRRHPLARQSVGTNRYAYAGNDPVNKADPNGHIWDTLWDAANVAYDAAAFAYAWANGDANGMKTASIDLLADSAALAVPFVPAGAAKVARALE